MNAAAGWFPDPAGSPHTVRWWNGQEWTGWLSSDPDSPPPGPEAGPTPPPSPSESSAAAPSGAGEPLEVPRAAVRSVRIPVALALIIGVLALGLVTVGFTVVLTEDRIRSGPAVAPPSADSPAGLVFEASTRTLRIENVRIVLPGPPYTCAAEPKALLPSFASALSCAAPVHLDYAGTDDWSANTGVGVIDDILVVPGDLTQTGRNLYASLRRQFFRGQRTTVERFGRLPNAGGPAQALYLGGEVHYVINGLPSRYDRMIIAVLALPGGRHVAFFSVRPDDTPKPALDALNRSIGTLTAR